MDTSPLRVGDIIKMKFFHDLMGRIVSRAKFSTLGEVLYEIEWFDDEMNPLTMKTSLCLRESILLVKSSGFRGN